MATNTMFPGRPDYTGPTIGLFGLLHHEVLVEESHDVMERVDYVRRKKAKSEVAIRLHNMIYLGGCESAVQRAPLNAEYTRQRDTLKAEYTRKRAPLNAEYERQRDTLNAAILKYIKAHIPDCAWNGKELVFSRLKETP